MILNEWDDCSTDMTAATEKGKSLVNGQLRVHGHFSIRGRVGGLII